MADVIYWVYQCNGTRGTATVALTSNVYPTCSPSGQGGWIQVKQVQPEPFDPATLDADVIATAFGAGFIVVGALLLALWSIALIIKAIRRF